MKLFAPATLNDDFQCSRVYTSARLGRDLMIVHHGCKDGMPSLCWMVVSLPGLGHVWIDVREISTRTGWEDARMRSDIQRARFIDAIRARFQSNAEIWQWAVDKNQPHLPKQTRASA